MIFTGCQTFTAQGYDYGDWKADFKLDEDEVILGIFGEAYVDYHCSFKKLGFVFGKI